jgi:hypothetical protein
MLKAGKAIGTMAGTGTGTTTMRGTIITGDLAPITRRTITGIRRTAIITGDTITGNIYVGTSAGR